VALEMTHFRLQTNAVQLSLRHWGLIVSACCRASRTFKYTLFRLCADDKYTKGGARACVGRDTIKVKRHALYK